MAARGTEAFMAAYLDFTRSEGVLLPGEGPMGRQANQFVRALRLADAERGRLEQAKRAQEAALAGAGRKVT